LDVDPHSDDEGVNCSVKENTVFLVSFKLCEAKF